MLPMNTSINSSRALWAMCLIMMSIAFNFTWHNKIMYIEWTILYINSAPITLPIILDPTGTMFASTVLLISANVLSFSNTYMMYEMFIKRFTYLVILFVTSMNLLIFIPHMMALLLGWDGLGLVSFLLVIYYQNPKSLGAGMITALTNRIGDVFILMSISLMLTQGHWLITNMNSSISFLTAIFIIVAAMTKSAQLPFSSWLPAAMAAPTPVSALVHSSTLVTAGIFLLIRFYDFVAQSPMFYNTLAISAVLTMFMAGMNAMAETDMKKIIALSTLSQLGVMMTSLSLHMPMLAFFHLITHALFKALLFICAGTLIHLHHHSQDLRTMGNLTTQMPLTMTTLTSANAALCGLPFMAGFYSKDLILEMTFFNNTNIPLMALFILATAMTAAYSIRMMMTSIWSHNLNIPMQQVKDNDKYVNGPALVLGTGALMGGCAMNWIFIAPAAEPWLPQYLKLTPLIITILGACMAAYSTLHNAKLWASFNSLHYMNATMWYLAPLSTQQIIKTSYFFIHKSLKIIDHGWLEFMGPKGVKSLFYDMSHKTQRQQTYFVTTHMSTMLILIVWMMYI